MLRALKIGDFTRCSHFSTPDGVDEFFIAIRTNQGVSFSGALAEIAKRYQNALDYFHLDTEAVAFSRLFLSDGANQKETLSASHIFRLLKNGALSVIEQKPLNGGPLSLFSYLVRGGKGKLRKVLRSSSADGWSNSVRITGVHYSLYVAANLMGERSKDPYAQSVQLFDKFTSCIDGEGMTLPDNVLRTWIYLRDIDCHYDDMVRARREFFDLQKLTDKTRFLASTGIEGRMCDFGNLISLDALAVGGLIEKQIVRVEAPSHLSPTLLYGVTFERGLAVRFGDRSHVYISGTASIDNKGEVLFLGDVANQTRRTLENIRALLATQKANLRDMAYFIAYARNFHDREVVAGVLQDEVHAEVPLIFVEAPVCRPAWLVELEGMAIIPYRSNFPPFL